MASQIWDTGEEVQPNVCQCLAIQYVNLFLSGGIPLRYRCIGDMLDPVFFSQSPKGDISLLSIFWWPRLRQEQSDWMLLNGTLSLEPGDKAEGTVRNNLGQHATAAVVPDILARLFQRTKVWVGHCLFSSLFLCLLLLLWASDFLPINLTRGGVSTKFPSNKSHWTWCLLLATRTLSDPGQPSGKRRACVL